MNAIATPATSHLPLAGKKGLITGIANDKSIAYAVARIAREQGAELAITYQNEKTAQYVAPLAQALGAKVFEKLDVTESGSLEKLMDKVGTAFDQLDFVIHSIAFCGKDDLYGRVIDSSAEGFANAMDISCHSFLRLAKAAEPLMKDGGTLVTMSYLGAERVVRNYNIMGVVKAALESSVRYMANELGPNNIRVFAVSPGPIATRAASGIKDFRKLIAEDAVKAPLGRTVTIDEVGALTAFLCSPAASGMTGQTIYVDAGSHIVA